MTKETTKSSVTTLDDAPSKASAPAAKAEAKVLVQHNDELSGKRKILTIHAEQGEGGNFAVFVGLNGVGYQVPRGIPHNVPDELVQNLRNAQQTVWENTDGKNVSREAPRFAFSTEDAPSVETAVAA